MTTAIYPGTFDPLTFGHLNIIQRASRICDQLIVGIAENSGKNPLFTLDERLDMAQSEIKQMQDSGDITQEIQVEAFTGLLTDFAHKTGSSMIIRGLRAVVDFEYEFQMASTNRRLKPDLETVFLTAPEQQHFVASSLVKEVARHGGDISSFVPERVCSRIMAKFEH